MKPKCACVCQCVCLPLYVSFSVSMCMCMPACECEFLCMCSHVCVLSFQNAIPKSAITLSYILDEIGPTFPQETLLPLCCRLHVQCPATGSAHSRPPTSSQNPVQDFPRIFSEALYLPNNLDVATDNSRSNQWIRLPHPPHTHTHTVAWRVVVGSPQGFCSRYHTGPEDKGHWA